jgi:hypothetical protein
MCPTQAVRQSSEWELLAESKKAGGNKYTNRKQMKKETLKGN